jgi:hypothetical protein
MTAPVLNDLPFLPQIIASPDVITSLTTYQLAMLKAYAGRQPPTLIQMGDRDTTSALAYKFPVSVGASVFRKLTGGLQYRKVGKLMLSVTTNAWGDGVMAEALDIQSDGWKGWGDQPESMAEAANLIGEAALAAAIEAGETTPSIENNVEGDTSSTSIKFFAQNKKVNPIDSSVTATYSNLLTSTGTSALGTDTSGANMDRAAPLTLANIDRVKAASGRVKSVDGTHYMDLEWIGVLVPKALEFQAERYFKDQGSANDMVNENITDSDKTSATGSKVYPTPNTAKRYGIQVYSSPYLTDPTTWYPLFATRTRRKMPWIELTQVPARQVEFAGAMQPSPQNTNGYGDIQWIIDDFTSEGYKHGTETIPEGWVGVAAKKRVGVALTWPFQMWKCKAT